VSAATPPQLSLKVPLIGSGISDPTTAAWQSALASEGVSFTEVTAAGAVGSETVTLPALTTGANGNYNGVAAAESLVLDLKVPPAFASAGTATSIVGAASSDTVTTTGFPAPALAEVGALPTGLAFVDNTNGTATISGTAASGTGGSFPLVITATSTSGTATQDFTLTNAEAPTVTSANTTSFVDGTTSTYTITTTGFPAATITETGTLPAGLIFSSPVNGTGTISGSTTAPAATYPVSILATNVSGRTVTLALTITVVAGGGGGGTTNTSTTPTTIPPVVVPVLPLSFAEVPGRLTINVVLHTKGVLKISVLGTVKDGGKKITAVQYSRNGTPWIKISSSFHRTFVIEHQTSGKKYVIRLRAVNSVGRGAASNAVQIRTK
jgi:hypothetical protein